MPSLCGETFSFTSEESLSFLTHPPSIRPAPPDKTYVDNHRTEIWIFKSVNWQRMSLIRSQNGLAEVYFGNFSFLFDTNFESDPSQDFHTTTPEHNILSSDIRNENDKNQKFVIKSFLQRDYFIRAHPDPFVPLSALGCFNYMPSKNN